MADFSGGMGAAPEESAPYTGRPYLVGENAQTVQAVGEGVVLDDDPNMVEFMGKKFRLAEKVGLMPLLRFANASKQGFDSDDMEGLAALYTVIRDTVDQRRPPKLDENGRQSIDPITGEPEWDGPSQWMLFEDHAINEQAEGEDLMDFVNRAMAVISARPRKRREISSGGSPQTSEQSKAASSSRVMPHGAEGLVPVASLGR